MAVTIKGKGKTVGIWLIAIFLLATHVFLRTAVHAEETTVIQSDWQKVETRTGDCSISFPTAPKLIQQSFTVSKQGDKLTYDVYLAPLNEKSLCLLLVAVYPYALKAGHELAGVEGLLNGIMGQSPDNKLLFANIINQNGHPTVDFLVQSPTSYFRGRAFMVGNKLYLMAIEGVSGALDEAAFVRFTQSFALISK
jgi:hypothetical protein